MAKTKAITHQMLVKLPLHKLLNLALADLRTHENTAGCIVYMGTWFRRVQPENLDLREGDAPVVCYACLAGSILAHTFKVMDTDDATYEYRLLSNETRAAAKAWKKAVDCLRCGDISTALSALGRRQCKKKCAANRQIGAYAKNREQWWADMRALLCDLVKAKI